MHGLRVDDDADLIFGEDSGEIGGTHRVVEIPIARGETGTQLVCSVRFDRGVARDRYPAFTFTDRGGHHDRHARVALQAPDLQGIRGGEQVDGARVGGLEPDRPGLRRDRSCRHTDESVQGTPEELQVLIGQ